MSTGDEASRDLGDAFTAYRRLAPRYTDQDERSKLAAWHVFLVFPETSKSARYMRSRPPEPPYGCLVGRGPSKPSTTPKSHEPKAISASPHTLPTYPPSTNRPVLQGCRFDKDVLGRNLGTP